MATLRGFVTNQSNGQALEDVNVAVQGRAGFVKGAATSREAVYMFPFIPSFGFRLTF